MQRTDSRLRAIKMDKNTKHCAKGTYSPSTQWTNPGLRAVKIDGMPRVVPGKNGVLIYNRQLCRWLFPKITLAHSRQIFV